MGVGIHHNGHPVPLAGQSDFAAVGDVVRPHLEAVVVDFHQLVVLPKQGDDLVYIVGELGVAAVANHMDAGVLGHLAPQVGALLHVGVLQPLQGQVVDRGHHPVQRPGVAGLQIQAALKVQHVGLHARQGEHPPVAQGHLPQVAEVPVPGGAGHGLAVVGDGDGVQAPLRGGPHHLRQRAVGMGRGQGVGVKVRYNSIRLLH